MPRWLTINQNRIPMNTSQEYLDLFKRDSAEYLRRFKTVDEIRIHHYTWESSCPNSGWEQVKVRQRKQKRFRLQEKSWLKFIWIFDVLHRLPEKKADPLPENIMLHNWSNWRKLFRNNVHIWSKIECSFYYDNVTAHTSEVIGAKLHDLRIEALPDAQYSLDLTISDYFLFPNLEKWLAERRCTWNDQIKLRWSLIL